MIFAHLTSVTTNQEVICQSAQLFNQMFTFSLFSEGKILLEG